MPEEKTTPMLLCPSQSYNNWPEIELYPSRWQAGYSPPEPRNSLLQMKVFNNRLKNPFTHSAHETYRWAAAGTPYNYVVIVLTLTDFPSGRREGKPGHHMTYEVFMEQSTVSDGQATSCIMDRSSISGLWSAFLSTWIMCTRQVSRIYTVLQDSQLYWPTELSLAGLMKSTAVSSKYLWRS